MFQQDYIKRLIEQLGDFLARVAKLAAGGRASEAEAEIAEAERGLGVPSGAERLDARSLAMILGGGDKVVIAASLAAERAKLADMAGDPTRAEQQRDRARQLLAAARPDQLTERAEALRAELDVPHQA